MKTESWRMSETWDGSYFHGGVGSLKKSLNMCLAGSVMAKKDQGNPQTPNRNKLADLAFSMYGEINTRIHRHQNCMQKVLKEVEKKQKKPQVI